MKTALLHYWLTNWRGGEKVLAALTAMYPGADIFTHAISSDMRAHFPGKVTESFIASLPRGRRKTQAYLPLMPLANRLFNLDGYDLILSSESGPIKGIRKPKGARHVCYCHTPMRYVWDMFDIYYAGVGRVEKIAMKLFRRYLQRADLKSADSVDTFIANSAFVANRIKRIYGRESVVVHPPVEVEAFRTDYERKDHYLLAGALVSYKRPELAIRSCIRMGRRLVVIGSGNQIEYLRGKYGANPLVTFLGRVDDATLRRVYGEARALIFPGVEDFGIVPVEAQAAGTPVIALGEGGALETVTENETGLFFPEPTEEALCGAIEEFESRTWSAATCRASVAHFGMTRFREEMRRIIG